MEGANTVFETEPALRIVWKALRAAAESRGLGLARGCAVLPVQLCEPGWRAGSRMWPLVGGFAMCGFRQFDMQLPHLRNDDSRVLSFSLR